MSHGLPYHLNNSLAFTRRSAGEGWRYGDKDGQSTRDRVPLNAHWHLAKMDGFTHVHTVNGIVSDPRPDVLLANRDWAEVQLLTDATGTLKYVTMYDQVALGVQVDQVIMLEAKAAALYEDPAFWEEYGAFCDSVGHPRTMMTLTNIGHPVRRLRPAHAHNFYTAALPRGPKPADWDTWWAPHVDAVWGNWV